MWRTRVPRVVWCFCAAFIMASATAAADVRFTGPTSHADQADQEEEAGVRSSAARLVAEAVSLPMHVLPDVTSRPYVRLGSEAPRQERPGALTGLGAPDTGYTSTAHPSTAPRASRPCWASTRPTR